MTIKSIRNAARKAKNEQYPFGHIYTVVTDAHGRALKYKERI